MGATDDRRARGKAVVVAFEDVDLGDAIDLPGERAEETCARCARTRERLRRALPSSFEIRNRTYVAASGGCETCAETSEGGVGTWDVPVVGFCGETALHAAARGGYEGIARRALDAGADADATRKDGSSVLMVAVRWCSTVNIVRMLLHKGVRVNADDLQGVTALHIAVRRRKSSFVRALLEAEDVDVHAQTINGDTPLHEAVGERDVDIIKLLLDAKADVHVRNKHGHTPISLAVENGLADVFVNELISPTSPESTGTYSTSSTAVNAMVKSCYAGHDKVVHCLVQHGVDVNGAFDARVNPSDEQRVMRGLTGLMAACMADKIDLVRALINYGADVNTRCDENAYADFRGFSAIAFAADRGSLDIVRLLIENGAVVNTSDGCDPIIQASDRGHAEIVRFLNGHGSNVHATRPVDGLTAIALAAQNGYEPIVGNLLTHGAVMDVESLLRASTNGHLNIVKLFVHHGLDPKISDAYGCNALMSAASHGHADLVRYLIKQGVEVNAKQVHDGFSALMLASDEGHVEVVRVLVESGALLDAYCKSDGQTSLTLATRRGHVDTVRVLLENGASVDATRPLDGDATLLSAARRHDLCIIRVLLEYGANVHATGVDGSTALSLACDNASDDDVEIVQELIRAGVSVNRCRVNGLSPLMLAARRGNSNIAKVLLQHGANVDAVCDDEGSSALLYASVRGHKDIVRALIDAGANVNVAQKKDGYTALMLAALHAHADVVETLIRGGADVNAQCPDTRITALWLANGHETIIKALTRAGAMQSPVDDVYEAVLGSHFSLRLKDLCLVVLRSVYERKSECPASFMEDTRERMKSMCSVALDHAQTRLEDWLIAIDECAVHIPEGISIAVYKLLRSAYDELQQYE